MNILITNDDGIEARGLQELVRALHDEAGAEIYVCAPDGQRSATGHGITMNRPIRVEEVRVPKVKLAYQTSGLPADCVKIAREFLGRKGIHIDMVFSGINHGGNLGTDTLYSGTVSAALEGSLCGIPSAAVSVDSHQAEHFEYICELAVNAAKAVEAQIEAGTADPRTVLNINTPNLPKDEIKGLRYTILGPREYDEIFVPAHMDSEEERLKRDAARAAGGREEGAASPEVIEAVRQMEVSIPGEFRYSGTPVHYPDLSEEYDVVANQDGYASITPIHTDLTHYDRLEAIRSWNLG
ncbi:MAG: 5'/3'-nucleotidase SurE [Firmicutes bacterium]|nr:5'/3'-nucleotidase SurE [Bacillota bacterium]